MEEKINEGVWPSRGVDLCRVKQVDSIFKSEGHQVLRHLRERKQLGNFGDNLNIRGSTWKLYK